MNTLKNYFKFTSISICLLLLLASTFSCEKSLTEASAINTTTSSIDSENGSSLRTTTISNKQRLVFKDSVELSDLLAKIAGDSTRKKDVIESLNKKNFPSLYKYYRKQKEKDFMAMIESKNVSAASNGNFIVLETFGEPIIWEAVDLEKLQILLNDDREIQVGEDVLVFNYDEILINDLKGNLKSKTKILRQSSPNSNKNARSILNYYDFESQEYSYNGNNYRVAVLSSYVGFTTVYFEKGGSIKAANQRKYLGIWFDNQTNYINLSGSAFAGTYKDPYSKECGANFFNTTINSVSVYNENSIVREYNNGYSTCYYDLKAKGVFNCKDFVGRTVIFERYKNTL